MTTWFRRLTQQEVLLVMLAKPRPTEPGLERIGYRYVQPRDPLVDRDALKRALGIAYVEHRRQAHKDESAIVCMRRKRGRATVIQMTGWRRA